MSNRSADEMPQWWPRGCDEELVRECNCDYCHKLADALDEYRSGIAVDGENQTLAAFANS